MRFARRRSSIQRRRSSVQSGSGTVDELSQETFFDDKTRTIPPYLLLSSESSSNGQAKHHSSDAAEDSHYHREQSSSSTNTQSVLHRVSSFNIMSRVSSFSLAENVASAMGPSYPSKLHLATTPQNQHGPEVPPSNEDEAKKHKDMYPSRPSKGLDANGFYSRAGAGAGAGGMAGTAQEIKPSWRLRDRMKTVGVGLVMALNVGTDPPDVVKPHPCAKLHCWMDPYSVPRQKAREKIGERLEAQYARWQQQRAGRSVKYRRALDPTVEDVRALCLWLRKQARQERILLHYNGHGVPRPTSNGEIWVFDRNHTEYIPLSVIDLKQWMGKPSIVVLDCSSAGILIPSLTTPLKESPSASPAQPPMPTEDPPQGRPMDYDVSASHWVKDTIVLCPTSEGEWLPMHPAYPADIFTSCLTTPIQMALRWFVRRNRHSMGSLNPDAVDSVPGHANDRKTPLGELNWIFTAVTDTIAWNVLPKPLFQRLFRQDLLLASMFRNFFLADRILRSLNCTPQSYPPLPPGIADHPLWQAWDLACETCLFELMRDGTVGNHRLVSSKSSKEAHTNDGTDASAGTSGSSDQSSPLKAVIPPAPSQPASPGRSPSKTAATMSTSISSPFFSEQLTAFEIWLDYAEYHEDGIEDLEFPEQLPIVLQVLLSQVHRIRALALLRRFLDLGPWAVNLSLSLGIFPYVMRLLQSPEYKTFLMGIWTSILKFDPSCQVDLVKDGALPHFIQPLATPNNPNANQQEMAQQRTMAAFSLAATCFRYPQGQTECLRQNLHGRCVALLSTYTRMEEQYQDQIRIFQQQMSQSRGVLNLPSPEPVHNELLSAPARAWLCLCLGNLVQKCPPAQREAFNTNMHSSLAARLSDNDPEVRAAAAYALGCLFEYVREPPPQSMPPAMSLGPGLQGMSSPTFQPGPTSLGQQRMPGGTTLPTALTASAVLSGRMQPGMTQQPNMMMRQPMPGRPGPNHSQLLGGGGRALQQQAGQIPLGRLMPGAQGRQPQLQPMFQPQGALGQPHPGQLQPMQPMQAIQAMQQMPRMQPMPNLQPQQMNGMQPLQPMQPVPFVGRPQPGSSATNPRLQLQQQGLRLGGQLMNGIPSMQQQQGMLRPQPPGQSSLHQTPVGTPNGQLRSPAGSLLVHPSTPDGSQVPPHLRRRPTVFEDLRRMGVELNLVETILKSLSDGSATVRYEALMALSNFVQKYLQAFLIAADDSSSQVAEDGLNIDAHETNTTPGNGSLSNIKSSLQLPNGLTFETFEQFASCWKSIQKVRKSEVHPAIRSVAGTLVSIVHESLLDARMENEAAKKDDKSLSGIAEEDPMAGDKSAGGRKQREIPQSDGPQHRIPKSQLIRTTSELGGAQRLETRSGFAGALLSPPNMHQTAGDRSSHKEKRFPRSTFFAWKRDSFTAQTGEDNEDSFEDRDPLNPKGAAKAYQLRRNFLAMEQRNEIAEHFQDLRPKPKQKKNEFDIILDESDDEADEKLARLKQDIKFKESKKLINSGVKMTSMLKFHTYEDILMVCDDKDGIAVWDHEQGSRKLFFKNGNPSGTRMTSSFWLNEQTKSLFFVGCSDGSARVWNGIVEDGHITSGSPDLTSSFVAVPDLRDGKRGSGFVCEWQQSKGTLIAGGNSSKVHTWNLAMEKCDASFDTGTDAEVTALATAWDPEMGNMHPSYAGMGPDVVVAGHSDGSLKIFDIRSPNGVATISGRLRKYTKWSEHRNWIVDVSFASHGGRYELVSGSMAGDIRAWDLRLSRSLRTIEAQRSPMTALTVHKLVPIAATGSHAQFIKIMSLGGENLQVVKFQDRASSRISPVSCLEFHKHKPILAVGSTTSTVSIFKSKYSSR